MYAPRLARLILYTQFIIIPELLLNNLTHNENQFRTDTIFYIGTRKNTNPHRHTRDHITPHSKIEINRNWSVVKRYNILCVAFNSEYLKYSRE